MDNSWIRVFPSHLCPSIKLPEKNWENSSLLLKITLSFDLQGKTHDVFHMNIQVKDFEVSMSQACLGKLLRKTHQH